VSEDGKACESSVEAVIARGVATKQSSGEGAGEASGRWEPGSEFCEEAGEASGEASLRVLVKQSSEEEAGKSSGRWGWRVSFARSLPGSSHCERSEAIQWRGGCEGFRVISAFRVRCFALSLFGRIAASGDRAFRSNCFAPRCYATQFRYNPLRG
jgi:hypothetical protein